MPRYSDREGDPEVIRAAYAEARKLTDNPVILKALFATGLVESGLHNLSGGDRDSQGFLQQRLSQGWKNPTNVASATAAFIAKAKRMLAKNPNLTAPQLAQAVQVSAYPERYAQAETAAESILTRISNGKVTAAVTSPNPGGGGNSSSSSSGGIVGDIKKGLAGGLTGAAGTQIPGANQAADSAVQAASDPVTAIAQAIATGLSPLKDIGNIGSAIFKAMVPTTLIRIVCGIAGIWFLFFGVVLLSREMRTR